MSIHPSVKIMNATHQIKNKITICINVPQTNDYKYSSSKRVTIIINNINLVEHTQLYLSLCVELGPNNCWINIVHTDKKITETQKIELSFGH